MYPCCAGIRRRPGLAGLPSGPMAKRLEQLRRGAEIPTRLARRRGGGTSARAGCGTTRQPLHSWANCPKAVNLPRLTWLLTEQGYLLRFTAPCVGHYGKAARSLPRQEQAKLLGAGCWVLGAGCLSIQHNEKLLRWAVFHLRPHAFIAGQRHPST